MPEGSGGVTDQTYGAKCHRCAHLLGSTHDVEPVPWLTAPEWVRKCTGCSFCQEDELVRHLQEGGLGLFSPEVRRAVHAFQRGEPDPILDLLRSEIQAIDDILPADEKKKLHEDLAKMARLRRRGEAEAANWPMP